MNFSHCLTARYGCSDVDLCTCDVQFVDGSSRLLSTAERESSPGWFAKEDAKPGAAKSLRMFMESFVTEKFLPEIYLDFR